VLRCYITDRHALGGSAALLDRITRVSEDIDLLQIREKDLIGRDLAVLVRRVLELVKPRVRVLVNSRLDIALACGAHGVHLPAHSISPATVRRLAPPDFLIAVSCHSVEDVRRAAREQAGFALLAPIFATPGKGDALGLSVLSEAARSVAIPVLALGGVTENNIALCREAGAAGFAAIRYFQGRRPSLLDDAWNG